MEEDILLKKHRTLLVGSKENVLELNAYETKYTFMSRNLNAGRSHNIKIDDSSFEMVGEFKYFGTTLLS